MNITWDNIFGWIVYNRAIVFRHQNFLQLVVHVIIIDHWNQTEHLYKIQVTVIYSRAVLVSGMSEFRVRNVLFIKPGLGHWQTVQTQIRCHILWHLIRVCTVCENYTKLRAKWNSFKSGPFPDQDHFPIYTQRQLTHQCCQYFEYYISMKTYVVGTHSNR